MRTEPMSFTSGADSAVLESGPLRLEIELRPFSFTLRRRGRRLLAAGGAWVADGEIRDHFVQFTEGVLAAEERSPAERAMRAVVLEQAGTEVLLGLGLHGGRGGSLRIGVDVLRDIVALEFVAEGHPLRLALDWDRRSEEQFVGLGARPSTQLDQAGRTVQLGADRRYTGPDCPPEMLAGGGIPQGDCAPTPWLLSSRGYAIWAQTDANGTRFELAGERVSVSTRAHAGPLRLQLLCAPTPAARLRAFCALTGYPALLPEWGYGFWKSRDVHEHQDDVLDDFEGFRRHGIPLDAIVIDSPWATQYNTWEFNPHQFPDAPGMIESMRTAGVRTVVWATPWVNLDSRDGQIPPQPESERLHREPAPNYAPGAAAGHFVREPSGEPFVTQWWMGTGSPIDFTSPAAEQWWREQTKGVLRLGVEGIKADDGDGYYIPDHVRLADGRTGAAGAWALGGLHRRSLQRALDEVHPGTGVLFGRFTPLMQAHGRMPQEPWHYSERVLELYRAYVLLHEQLVPYVRAAAATAARTGLPIMRPLCLTDPRDSRGWSITDAYGYGPALWVAPVLDEGAREREVPLPAGDWIETWSGRHVRGGGEVLVEAPLAGIPVWVRSGSIVVSYPAAHVAAGLGDVPEAQRPLVATLWAEPRLGRATARLADGTLIRWRRGRWSVSAEREVSFDVRAA